MNWPKAKTILIIFFLCTNLFLLAMILSSTSQSMILTDDIVSSTVTILANNRIELSEEQIPRKTILIPSVTAKNAITDYSEFSKYLLGETATMTEAGKYESEIGTVTFRGDCFDFQAKTPVSAGKTQNKETLAKNFLLTIGINPGNADADTSGENTVTFSQTVDGYPLFSSSVSVEVSNDGIVRAQGCWFHSFETEKDKPELKNIASILIDFVTLSNRPATPDKIESLEFGYGLPTDTVLHPSVTLYPAWNITLDTGEQYVLDARESL